MLPPELAPKLELLAETVGGRGATSLRGLVPARATRCGDAYPRADELIVQAWQQLRADAGVLMQGNAFQGFLKVELEAEVTFQTFYK